MFIMDILVFIKKNANAILVIVAAATSFHFFFAGKTPILLHPLFDRLLDLLQGILDIV